ncbi:MAG: HD domain-containing protein [Candidatus Vogelbacteria bacterium]|nr:HD domain-containing protein [Candidatus Vogelbacteria bacterium]
MEKLPIPQKIRQTAETLEKGGFEAYLVGGCVRDLLLSREPNDWDITTNAKPEQIQALYPHTYYTNKFGTVGVVIDKGLDTHVTREPEACVSSETAEDGSREIDEKNVVEITPYRLESKYSDFRHPDHVAFSNRLEDDLGRRDFTINALAYSVSKGQLIDLYKGQCDIKDKLIRAVGEPDARFSEDALRMLRAVRLSAQLGFAIESETNEAILRNAHLLEHISAERIQEELGKIIMCDNAMPALQICHLLGLMKYIIPELEDGLGIEQRGEHIYDVWEHNLRSLNHAINRGWPFHVRLAALLHDVAKPKTRQRDTKRNIWTFHGHDVVGAKMTAKIMARLKFSRDISDKITKLVRYHLFFSDVDKITLSAVRRIVRNVGPENVWDLMKLRACDRIGTGRPKEAPYRLRKYEAMIEEAMRSPVTVQMLKIDGTKIMENTKQKPGPKIGLILNALMEEVLDNPDLNTRDYLENKTLLLNEVPIQELQRLANKGKEKKEGIEAEEIGAIRKKHGVE